MKERTIFERIVLVLGVVLSTIVWLLRLVFKLVQGALKETKSGARTSALKQEESLGTVRMYESETDPNEPERDVAPESAVAASDAIVGDASSDDDAEDEEEVTVFYRDVPDTVTHPEDDPDHEDNAHIHYRDVSDTVTHPEDDPDHEDNGHVHYRDVSDVVEVSDLEGTDDADELTESVAHGAPAGSTEFVADDAAIDVEHIDDTVAESTDDEAEKVDASTADDSGMIKSADGSCPITHPIKGNASSRIYHVPEAASYENTRAEFCFASAEAAEAAGYRAPKR